MMLLNVFLEVSYLCAIILEECLGSFSTLSEFVMEWNPIKLIDFMFSYTGMRSYIDVGAITGESGESHYFINVADVHL